ncbi:F-BAR domain only protein 1 [Schistosoma japonicum]|nr:F-BAR domain only protein 1 [Schistosoma japonicum]
MAIRMSSCLFSQHFWGEKNSGFDAMYQNFKLSYRNSSEFADFLRESYSAEDNYYKTLVKLSKQAGSYNSTSSFKPYWSLLKQFLDQISQVHLNIAQERQNLSRDVQKYLEEQHKRQKLIKDTEASTQEVVHAFQVTSVQLQKAKEAYHSRYNEYERAMRLESGSNRDQEKLEVKLKKAQDEYKYSVEKYNNLRNQFVSKMHISCAQFEVVISFRVSHGVRLSLHWVTIFNQTSLYRVFPEIEVSHLEQMREFLHRYASVWSVTGDALEKLHNQFDHDLAELTTDRLLNILVSEKGTGTMEPQSVQFEDPEVAAAFSSNGNERANGLTGNSVRVFDAFLNREGRAASALASSSIKDNGEPSLNSLTDVKSDAVSLASISVGVAPSVTNISISGNGTAKRREGFFRRRRNSLSQESTPTVSDNNPIGSSTSVSATIGTNASIQTSGGSSLSAFTVVAKRGIRRLGTPYSNGKDKPAKQLEKSDTITLKSDDWRTTTPVELPKDEDGYNIRPYDPWGENLTHLDHSEVDDSDSEEDLENEVNKTFHGLKVSIRPVGEFAPGVALKYNGDKLESRPKFSEAIKSKNAGNSQGPLLIDHRVGSTLRSPRSSISSHQNIPITVGSSGVSSQDLINALPLPPLLPPPPSVSFSTSEPFPPLLDVGGGSVRVRSSGASSFNALDKYHSISAMRPRGYSCNTWTKNVSSNQLSSVRSFESRGDNNNNTAFNLSSFDSLFTTQETKTNKLHDIDESIQKKCPSDFVFCLNDSVSCDRLVDTLQRSSSSVVCVDSSPVNNSDGSIVRRCSSTAPTSTDDESINQSNWMSFETNATGTRKSSPSIPWPSFNANIQGSVVSKEGRAIPEPPARLHSHLINSLMTEPAITPSPSVHSFSSPNNNAVCLAAAFTETWHARFFNDLQPKLSGSSISLFSECTTPTDTLRSSFLENLPDNVGSEINDDCSDYVLTIPGDVLSCYLAPSIMSYSEENSFSCSNTPSDRLNTFSSSTTRTYIKLDVLTYTVDVNANINGSYPALTPPIHLCTYWRCEAFTTDFRLDYTAQWPTIVAAKEPMKNTGDLRINLMVDGAVSHMQSLPVGAWLPEFSYATWRIPLHNGNINDRDLSRDNITNNSYRSEFTSKFDATGTVRAKFTLTNGPGKPQPVSLQFFCDGTLASGVQLTVISSLDYHMKLCKYRLIGDRYVCDPPTNVNRFHSNSTLQLEQNNNIKERFNNSLVVVSNNKKY